MQGLERNNTICNLLYVNLFYLENKKYVEVSFGRATSTHFVHTTPRRSTF